MRVLVIGNPISGGGRARQLIESLTHGMAARGWAVDVFLTAQGGDARARAARLESCYDCLVVSGGDGTLNEVVNGLQEPGQTPIAFLPAGTGNVLAHELQLSGTPDKAIAAIASGRIRKLDLAVCGERRFLMIASAGFDAAVTREIGRTRKGKLGKWRYAWPVLKTFFAYKPTRITVTVDDLPPVAGKLVIVLKTSNYGGVFMIDPDAHCDSGIFHVCVLEEWSFWSALRYTWAAMRGRLLAAKRTVSLTGREVTISADRPTPVEIDGDFADEIGGQARLNCRLTPKVVPVFIEKPMNNGNNQKKFKKD